MTPEAPRETRFGGMFPIEGDRWIVSMGGWMNDHAPTDEQGFLEYARNLPAPDIYNLMSQSEPLSEITPYKFSSSLRRHYEKLARFPEGYLALGDAICSFNPTYGQGMTSAAMQAAALDALLVERKGNVAGLAPAFFKRAAKIVDTPWQLAVGEDFRFPQTTGPKPGGVDFINRYVAQVHRASLLDAEVCRAFLKVMNLLEPPSSLMMPRMMLRVLRASRRQRQRSRPTAPVEARHRRIQVASADKAVISQRPHCTRITPPTTVCSKACRSPASRCGSIMSRSIAAQVTDLPTYQILSGVHSMSDNLAVIGAIYEAFGRGDIPTILGHLADDVRWEEWADNTRPEGGRPLAASAAR